MLISIVDCVICKNLLQKQTINEDAGQKFPSEVKRLIDISSSIKKCPLCATFYHLEHYDICIDPLDIPVKTENRLRRCSFIHSRDLLNDPNGNAEDINRSIGEWDTLKVRQTELVKILSKVIKTKGKKLSWQIKKYIIEFLTDFYLIINDWAKFHNILLKNEDPVVRVQSAYDILILASEPNTGKRYFTGEIQGLARNLLLSNKIENCLKLIHIFTKSLQNMSETYEISLVGYKKIPLNHVAFEGLSNASYRGFNIAYAIPSIIKWLSGEDVWQKDNAYYLLKELLKRNKVYSNIIHEELSKIERVNKEIAQLHKHCKISMKNDL